MLCSGGRTLCAGGQQQWHGSTRQLHDPVWHYATRCRWQGIALEPVNSTFQRLQNNYAPFPRVQPVRAAVSDRTGRSTRDGDGHRLERRGDTLRLERQGAEMWRAGRRPKERRSTVTLEIPKNIKFLKASHRHKHLERGVQNRINESLHQQGYRLAITSIGHGANPGDLLYARAAGPYAGGACQATGPTGPSYTKFLLVHIPLSREAPF